MNNLKARVSDEIFKQVMTLPMVKLNEVLEFVCFIKAREVIDPTQSYFWTKKWQKMEKRVEKNKRENKIIGNGTLEGLLKELHK